MANIMSLKQVNNHVHRNGFDLSFRNLFTAKPGQLLPVMCKEVLPGDTFSIDLNTLTRTQPVQTAAFTRIQEYYDFYFVPTNLLWDKFDNYIIQTNNYNHAGSLNQPPAEFTTTPYFLADEVLQYYKTLRDDDVYNNDMFNMQRSENMLRLMRYLGYGNFLEQTAVNSVALNPFPLLAYQKICQDYFRFSQWQTSEPYRYNLDWALTNAGMHINVGSIDINKRTMFDLNYCTYKKDMFMGLLPKAQFGSSAIASPILGHQRMNVLSVNPVDRNDFTQGFKADIISANTSPNDVNGTGLGPSVFALRFAEASQKWKEVTQSGSLDYRAQLEKHWNVKATNEQSYMCDYLGGTSGVIAINEVVNTNLSSETDQTLIAGKGLGTSSKNGVIRFNAGARYGYLLCIYHAVPLVDYASDGIDRTMLRVNASSYAIPEFDSLGMEEVNSAVYSADTFSSITNSRFLGYAPRYIDYKTSVDKINGAYLTSLKDWVVPASLNIPNLPNAILDYRSFLVSPRVLDPIFLPQASADSTVDSDPLLCSVFFDIKAVRNLSASGLPY